VHKDFYIFLDLYNSEKNLWFEGDILQRDWKKKFNKKNNDYLRLAFTYYTQHLLLYNMLF